jgi:hypothetical protein
VVTASNVWWFCFVASLSVWPPGCWTTSKNSKQ